MKRVHTLVSRSEAADTPLPVLGKKCRQHGLVGTPVEGLTGMPVTIKLSEAPSGRAQAIWAWGLNLPLACAG
jgi:hypothetical protein